ncbi:MAG: hypothetical protein ISS14_01335 [Actinobacteria bacterium]|nr:hypothetical protein [Actinomycetota bacterium]MBL7123519.1 hypothetical protein [Actinomycetota bacterium]
MIDVKKLHRVSYMSKRMYVIRDMCEHKNFDIKYLFGLFNYYSEKNKGDSFWERIFKKASFTGTLKETFDKFNSSIDELVKNLKVGKEEYISKKYKEVDKLLADLVINLEEQLGVEREADKDTVRGCLDENLKQLIESSLKGL